MLLLLHVPSGEIEADMKCLGTWCHFCLVMCMGNSAW